MTATAAAAPPRRALHELAIFLDLDGTLAPIAASPDEACVPSATLTTIKRLHQASGGALAIVSGRDGSDIKRMLAPLDLPYAALHGAQLRRPDGRVDSVMLRKDQLAEAILEAEAWASSLPGILVERKALSIAIHYRNAPELREAVAQFAESVVTRYPDFALQEGKMVAEIKPKGVDKGNAIDRFMAMPPFSGRVPLMVGDDLTDESAFDAVNRLQGISVKIGPEPTSALWRLTDPPALSAWLDTLFPPGEPKHAAASSLKDET